MRCKAWRGEARRGDRQGDACQGIGSCEAREVDARQGGTIEKTKRGKARRFGEWRDARKARREARHARYEASNKVKASGEARRGKAGVYAGQGKACGEARHSKARVESRQCISRSEARRDVWRVDERQGKAREGDASRGEKEV
jgi:hypothetical protein